MHIPYPPHTYNYPTRFSLAEPLNSPLSYEHSLHAAVFSCINNAHLSPSFITKYQTSSHNGSLRLPFMHSPADIHIPQVNPVYIVSASRTPVGAKDGSLATVSAPQLGVVAVKHAVEKAGIKPEQVEELYMGNVVQAGVGQSPARQVGIGAGCVSLLLKKKKRQNESTDKEMHCSIPETTDATTINKVCASGMKAIMLATQNIQLGQRGIMVAGGMESMSQAP